jgi:hypothetical protein
MPFSMLKPSPREGGGERRGIKRQREGGEKIVKGRGRGRETKKKSDS